MWMDRRVDTSGFPRCFHDRIRYQHCCRSSPYDDGYYRFLDEGFNISGDNKHPKEPRKHEIGRSYGLDCAHDVISDPVFVHMGS